MLDGAPVRISLNNGVLDADFETRLSSALGADMYLFGKPCQVCGAAVGN
jgi:hypothetical protein